MYTPRRLKLALRPHRGLRRSPRAVWRMLRLTPLGAGVAVLAGLPAISAWAQAAGVAANVIKPDGRTATQQQVVGTRTDITTGTVRGDNAFNSFSRFEVGQGQTVNVHVPAAAQRVINIVTDAPVRVDGVLNGLKDGSISGNLVFADPMGMVVSKSGVINVNSLQVVATTRAHADAMLDGQGRIGDAAVQQLLDGKAPRSAEGRVQMDGKINALERVRIEARRIDVDGRIKAGLDAAHDAAFRNAVSSNGLNQATGMVERGGVIELVADDAIRVAGTLDASQRQALSAPEAPQAGLGGSVRLLASDIELTATSRIDVSGLTGGGVAVIGSISLPTVPTDDAPEPNAPLTQNLTAAAGSVVEADAIERGNGGRIQYLSDGSNDWGGFGSSRGGALMGRGGFIEVSGRRRVQVHGLVDTTAPKGATGTLLIDPEDLTISDGVAGGSSCLDVTTGNCTVTTGTLIGLAGGANLVLRATDSINFSDGTTLDLSGVLTLNTQSISFTSQDITLNSNAKILTGGGAVNLIALGSTSVGDFGSGKFKYDSKIGLSVFNIGEEVKGGTIHMASGSAIITRGVANAADAAAAALVRDAGDVTLRGQTLQLDSGSSILAHSTGASSKGGAIELTGYSAQQYYLGKATATSQVNLAGTVKADSIVVNSVAKAEATPDGVTGYAVQIIAAQLGALTGMGAAYHETQADARIDVQGTARLEAATTLDIASVSFNKAAGSVKVYTVKEDDTNLAALGAIYVRTGGISDVKVKSGATLKSGGKTTVAAYNDATAKGDVNIFSTNSIGGAAVSYVAADVSSNAQIDAGATVNVGALDLLSLQTGNMRNTAAAKIVRKEPVDGKAPPPDAAIGATVAISDIEVHSTAMLGANVRGFDGTGSAGDVTVVSDASLWQNMTSARNAIAPIGLIDKAKAGMANKFLLFGNVQSKLTTWLSDKFDALGSLKSGSPPIKASAAVTVNETDLTSSAKIGAGANILSSGNVAVVAQTEDRSLHNIADSKVNTKNSAESKPAGSAAVAVGLYNHGAEATVGQNADITGRNVGVQAQVYQPLDVTWLASFTADGWKDVSALFKHFTPPSFGMPEFVFTSWASAVAEQEQTPGGTTDNTASAAVAGAVNWTSFKNTTTSWVGTGAKITATGGDQPWSIAWSSPKTPVLDGASKFDGEAAEGVINNILVETSDALGVVKDLATNAIGEIKDLIGGAPVVLGITLNQGVSFEKALQVKALNQSAFLTFTGQPVDIGFSGVNIGTQSGTTAVGGAFNYAGSEHTTVAGIDDGAIVRASLGTISVKADSQDRIIAVAPTAGKGAGAAVNLIAAYSQLDNTTVAVLSNKADAKAAAVDISAVEDVSVWSAAGAAAFGASAAAVGVAVAVNELDGRTLATIADPGSLSVGVVRPTGFNGGSGVGQVDALTVRVQADTQGTSGAISASAASVESKDTEADKNVPADQKSAISKKWESLKGKTSDLRSKAVTKLQSTDESKWYTKYSKKLGDKIAEKQEAPSPVKPPKQSSTSLAAAGSASVNLGNLDTTSLLDGARLVYTGVKPANQTDASQLVVRATNETHQYAISGSLAVLKLNAPETKTGYGVSGAITIDLEENDTTARILNSSIKDYGTVGVQSVASGQRISVGLGVAGSSGSKPSYMVGVSYSMTDSDNSTTAAIDGGSIDGSTANRTAVEVLAYDKTETGVGAGALTVQGNKGGAAGASIGVALVHNTVESRVAGTQTTNLGAVDVRAYDPVVLGIGAASLGISTEPNSTTIEASVTYGEVDNTTKAGITDLNGVRSKIDSNANVTVQATDAAPAATKARINTLLSADGTPEADGTYDFGASLRSGSQESFGGQSIGTTQPGALVIGVAGGIAVGSGNSVGAAVSASRVASVHEALVEGTIVDAAQLNVDATDSALVVNVGIGVAGTAQKTALAGSVAITVDESRATARVGTIGKVTSVTTTGSGGLGVTAATSEKAFAVAGSVAISTQGSAGGIAGTIGVDNNIAEALIQSATINTGTAAAQVQGSTSSQHISVAAAGGYGANASINGSFVINFSTERTTASVADSNVTADSLAVKAGDDANLAAQVYTGAGSFGFSKNVAGGAALTSNTVALTRDATVERSVLKLGSGSDALDVQADSSVKMIGVTVAGGGGGQVAFNGAISSNEIANKTTARVAGNQIDGGGTVSVVSGDRSEMDYGTAAVSIGSEAGIGVAIGFNLVTNDITAQIQGTDKQGNSVGTGKIVASDVRVAATTDERIVNAAYGVGGSGTVGGAGSIAVNVIDSDVVAHIGRGADIRADGTVAVTATSQDDIKNFAGALGIGNNAGIGLSATTNVIRGSTNASIGADDEARVNLDAEGNGAGLSVNSGTLATAIPGITAPNGEDTAAVNGFNGLNAMKGYDATRAKMAETQTTVKGVAVNATSMRHVLSYDTTLGLAAEGLGIGANAGAHVISSTTTGAIANANVNQRDAQSAAADVAVKSTSHHVMTTFGFSGAAGAGGGAGVLGGDVFITRTKAQIRDSAVKAGRDVNVTAKNEQAQSGILAGVAAGGTALAGSAGVIVFDSDVEASILGGTTRAERDVVVDADQNSLLNMITGAGSLGGGLAAAGAITVAVSDTSTHAYIGRSTDTTNATLVRSGRDVNVTADSGNQMNTFTMAISGGGTTAIAAIGAVAVVTNDTAAEARHADLEVGVTPNWVRATGSGSVVSDDSGSPTNSTGTPSGKLKIQATDHGLINQISGAAGLSFGGGGGIGGTVSVLVAKSHVAAALVASEVDTGDVSVKSLNTQDQLAATVGVGAATDIGVGFAISLTMTGTGAPGSDAFGNASDSNSKGTQLVDRAASVANTNRLGETGGTLSAADRNAINAQSKRDISGILRDAGSNSASSAIDASVVRASGNVEVKADQDTGLKNIAGAGGVGLLAGAGGSVGVSYVYNATAAQVTNSNIDAHGTLSISADSGDLGSKKALDLLTVAGGAGLVGLGASVGVGSLRNDVSAQANGSLSASGVTISANDSTSAKAENVAAAVGGGALGIAVSTVSRSGAVDAWVNRSGAANQILDAGSLSITATSDVNSTVISRAVAAGLTVSGNGAGGTATDSMAVRAGIGNNTQVAVGGDEFATGQSVTVRATRGSKLDSQAEGVGVSGGVQIGASVALSTLGGSTEASVGTGVQFDRAATLDVSAIENSGNLIKTKGSASGGGVLVGANATYVKSENTATTTASIGDNTLLPDGIVDLHANHAAIQTAESFGVTVGGLLAVGANTSEVVTSASSTATLGNVKTNTTRQGDLDVAAQGNDKSTAKAVAGGGGLISGQAATATINDTSNTTAIISAAGSAALANPTDYTLRGGAISLDASRLSEARADADTVNASAVGASGAITLTTVNNSANATVGAGVRLRGLGIGVSSTNAANEPDGGDNVAGAGGGVANGSAAVAKTHFTTTSNTTIGNGAKLDVIGDPTADESGRLVVLANTDLFTRTKGSLNTGGVIDVPYAEIESTATGNNNVTIGDNAQLRSVGDIVLGTSALNRTNAQALIKTYGGIGITGGKSSAISTQTDNITVNDAALLQAYGDISLATGRNADNALNLMEARAITDVYNNTAIPISYQNPAVARTNQISTLNLLGSSQVQAGQRVYLRTFKGDNIASATGEGHNPYLDLFSTSTSDSTSDPKFAGTIQVNGSITAGYYRLRDMAINPAGALSQTTDTPDLQLPVVVFTMDGSGNYRNANNQIVNPDLALRPRGYIARIDGFNPSLYYSDTTKAKIGGVPNEAMGAYVLPDLYVAGGSIEVDSTAVTGNGTLRAQGGPLIRVVNDSNSFVIANKMVIPDLDSGGSVSFLGAGSKPASLTVQEIDKGRLPAVELNNRYDTAFGGTASDIVIQSTLDGSNAVRNLQGSYKLNNDKGNIIEGGVEALTIEVKAPNGASIFDDASKYFPIGGAPEATWATVDAGNRPNDIGGFVDTAAYYYYRNNLGGTSTSNKDYSRTLQGIVDNKGSGITGYLFRKNLGNKPGSYGGDGAWYDGRYGFDILPVKTLSYTSNGAPTGPKSPGRLANRIDYTARYIDINAPIKAGSARDIDITITSAAIYRRSWWDSSTKYSFFDCIADISCRNYNGFYAEANGLYKVPASTLVYGANSPLVTVTFDAVSRRVSTAPIGTASIGAVSLVGRILNSNNDGSARSKVELSTGTIQLSIKNQSGFAFETPQIETGGATGDGVIRITDQNRTANVINKRGESVVAPLTTWWVSKNGSTVDLYQSYAETSYVHLTPISSGTGSTASTYDPQAGWRYQWTRSANATRQLVNGGGAWWDWYASDWSFKNGASSPDWVVSGEGPVFAGFDSTAYRSNLTANVGFSRVGTSYSYNGAASRTWAVATSITMQQNSSVRADYGLDISFKGYSTGGVTIASNATTYLGRGINNPTGSTSFSITNGDLIARDGGLIRSKDLSLNVTGNVVGSGTSGAVDVELGGVLSAVAGGNLAVKAVGDLKVVSASAGQNKRLSLSAHGNLTSTSSSVVLRGYDVSLTSTSGRIGGAGVDDPLNVEVYNIGSGVSQRGLLSAKADGNVNLNLTGGDIRVATIQATDGDVKVSTNGSLFDAKEAQGGTARSDDDLKALWEQTLKISGDKTASVQDYLRHTITPLDQQVNRDYRDYWTLRSLGTLGGNGQITLSAKGLGALRAQAAAGLNKATPSDADVQTWADTLLVRYAGSFDRLLGAGKWQAQTAFQAFDAGFRFSADRYNEYWTLKNATVAGQLTPAGRNAIRQVAATVIGGTPTDAQLQTYVNQRFAVLTAAFGAAVPGDKLTSYDANYRFSGDDALLSIYATGSYWGAERLQNEIRQSAFGTASSGSGTIDHLNISGRKVTLTSSAGAATLGRDNGYLNLAIGQPLSDIARYALSQASAPGDVQVVVNAAGQVTGLKVKDTRPFFVDAKTQFDATSPGQLYVLGKDALSIGLVQSNGSVRLAAQAGITNAAAAQAIKGSSLVLDGGTGALGSAASPLLINTPELSLARAGDSIWLRQASGNLVVDAVSAEKDIFLTLGAGNLSQKQKGLLSMAGDNITLDVSGNVGTDPAGAGTGALVLGVRDTLLGQLKLNSKDTWLASGADLRLGDSSTGIFGLNLLGSADLTLSGDVTAIGAVNWLIGGDTRTDAGKALDAKGDIALTTAAVTMGVGSTLKSGGKLALYSGSDAVLGSLTAKTGMTLDAELGSLMGNAANVLMTVQDAGGSLKFNSLNTGGAGIGGVAGGDPSAPLRVAADRVSLSSAAGDVQLSLLNPIATLDAASVGAGKLTVDALGSLVLAGQVSSAQAMHLAASQNLRMNVGSAITAGDTAALVSRAGDVQLTNVQTVNGLSVDAQGSITRTAASDLLSASAAGGRIELNANSTAGTGLGTAAAPLRLSADIVSARTASGGVYLDLLKTTTIERAGSGSGDVVLNAAADLHATGPVTAVGDTLLQVTGALTGTDVIRAGRDLTLSAASLNLSGELSAGRDARLTSATGDLLVRGRLVAAGSTVLKAAAALQAQDVATGLDLTIDAGGPVRGDSARAGRLLTVIRAPEFQMRELISGTDMSLALGNAEISQLTAGARLTLDALNATLGSARSGGDALITTAGSLALGSLTSGGNARLLAPRNLNLGNGAIAGNLELQTAVGSLGNVTVGGSAVVSTSVLDVGLMQTGGNLALTSGDLTAGQLVSGSSLEVSTSNASITRAESAGSARLRSGSLTLGAGAFGSTLDVDASTASLGTVRVASDAALRITDSLAVTDLDVGRRLDLQAQRLVAGRIAAVGNASLVTSRDLSLATGQFGADLALQADGATLGSIKTVGNAKLNTRGDLGFEALDVGGALQVDALAVKGNTLKVGKNFALTAQTARVGAADVLGDADLVITGRLAVTDRLSAVGALRIQADELAAASLAAGGALGVQARAAQIDSLKSGGNTTLAVVDRLAVGQAVVAGALVAQARDVSLANQAVTGSSTLKAERQLALSGISSFAGALEANAQDITVDTAKFGGATTLKASGLLRASTLEATGELALSAQRAQLGRVTTSAALDVAVMQDLALDQLAATGATRLKADAITGRDWAAAALALEAGTATLGRLAATGDVSLTTTGALALEQARLSSQLTARAASMQLGDIAVGGDAMLRATALIKAQRLDVTGALDMQAAALELGAVQPITPLADVSQPGVKVGGALTLNADQIALADALIGGAASLVAKDTLSLQGSSSFKAGLAATAEKLAISTASVTGDARLTSVGATDIGQLLVSGNASLKAGTRVTVGRLDAATADLTAANLTLGSLTLGNSLKATAMQDLTADSLVAATAIVLETGGSVQAKLVDAASVNITSGQQIGLDLLKAGTATLRSATQIAIASGQVNSIDLQAPLLQGALKVASGDTLITRISGVNGAAAEQVTLSVDTPLRWQVPVLNAANAQFSTTGRLVQFEQARIADSMTLATPGGLIGLTSAKVQVLPRVDVQLYTPTGDFKLVRDGVAAYTTALAVVYKPGQQVSAPNTSVSPMAAAAQVANGNALLATRPAPLPRPGQLALSYEALLLRAPTAAGDKDDELVGELEF